MMENKILIMTAGALDGDADILEIFHYLKELKDTIDESLEQLQPLAVTELAKWKERTMGNISYKIKNGAGRWDYKGVSQWNEKKEQLKGIEEMAKQASKGTIIADENGEIIKAATYIAGVEIIYREKIKVV